MFDYQKHERKLIALCFTVAIVMLLSLVRQLF